MEHSAEFRDGNHCREVGVSLFPQAVRESIRIGWFLTAVRASVLKDQRHIGLATLDTIGRFVGD